MGRAAALRRLAKPLLHGAVGIVLRHPRLKRWARATIDRLPRVQKWLYATLNPSAVSAPRRVHRPQSSTDLSPRAAAVYHELKQTFEARDR